MKLYDKVYITESKRANISKIFNRELVTGIRRCGKSYLVFNIFKNYLMSQGVLGSHIVTIELDQRKDKKYRDPDVILII